MREVRRHLGDALLRGERAKRRERGVRHQSSAIFGRGRERREKHGQALRQPGSDALVGAEILREEFGDDDGGVCERGGSAAEDQLDERLGGGGADASLRLSLGGGGAARDVHLLLHRVLVQRLEPDGGFVQRREKRRLERTRQRVVLVVVVRLQGRGERVDLRGAVEEREVAQRLGGDATHRGRVRGERGAEHANALPVRSHSGEDAEETRGLDRLAAHGGGGVRHPRSNERRGDRLGGVRVDGGPRRVLEKERAQEQRLRVRLVRVHLDAERVRGGEHGGGGVRGRIAHQSRRFHQRAFPRARPAVRVRRHHPRDVEVRVVGGGGRGTELPVDELRGASSRGAVGEVDELEEREELPGDESRAGVGVIGDER